MLVSYAEETTVSDEYKGDGMKIVQSYGNLRVEVSGCSSSAGFLGHSSVAAGRIVSDSLLWEI